MSEKCCAITHRSFLLFFLAQQGDLKNEEAVLAWLSHQVDSDEIEDVTDEMLDLLIARSPSLAALFCTI